MRPVRLTMQAFESYGKKTVVDFTKPNQNLFLITGDTGSGKTTIFDAVVFALYGENSSVSNKRDGADLYSQYAERGTEPYVELVFTEHRGGIEEEYTVRRVPRHMRPAKRRGSKDQPVSESVSLILPDGSEYPARETDEKLEEITGLTKNQFMQVAMIAQGEFMELLRAKTTEKREIFRRLFNTEMFQRIQEEFKRRSDEKESEMERIHTVCRQEAGRVKVPEMWHGAEQLEELRKNLISAGKFSVSEMEQFLSLLEELCGKLDGKKKQTAGELEKLRAERDRKRDACTKAEALLKSFRQMEDARKELARCEAESEKIEAYQRLAPAVDAAYEIKGIYDRYADAAAAAKSTLENLEKQRNALPGLKTALDAACEKEKAAAEEAGEKLSDYTKISERVSDALEIFGRIGEAEKDAEAAKNRVQEARKKETAAESALSDFDVQTALWRKREAELTGADRLLAEWQGRVREAETVRADVETAEKEQKEIIRQKQTRDQAAQAYIAAREVHHQAKVEYDERNAAFLDAQAGLLASELEEGQPCPVCGSLTHPHPALIKNKQADLTRESINRLKKQTAELHANMLEKMNASASAGQVLDEKKKNFEKSMARLKEHIASILSDPSSMPEELTPERAGELLAGHMKALEQEGAVLKENAAELEKVRKSLENAGGQRDRLSQEYKKIAEAAEAAGNELTRSRTTLENLRGRTGFGSAEEAAAARDRAAEQQQKAEHARSAAADASREAKKKVDRAEGLAARYAAEFPDREKESAQRRSAYEKAMADRDLAESEWKEMTLKYEKNESARLRGIIDDYSRRRALALGSLETAEKAVGGSEKPDLEKLEEERDEAEAKQSGVQEKLETINEYYKTDNDAYNALKAEMNGRAEAAAEYARIRGLYERLAGKRKGARMDIETYVQRYYLKRILQNANMRFRDMSAGQFELRMTDAETAGDGRNKGLDLMVYSAVTGKEREVRTLSGGESFMAALSLALGMADQIQETSASVNLDMMFIDEGFGSLDDHSRDQAVKVLKQMAGGSKLIGIISHVTELKQEIEDQLLVSKDEEGSHVKWQIS